MNLIHDPWIPVERQSGHDRIAPWQITDLADPVLHVAAPRPDFDGALLQFLIGLLQSTCIPKDDEQWAEWLEKPPSPETLKKHFDTYAHAFVLDAEPPRFMQDSGEITGDDKPIASLLIDAPGEQTLKQNKDHFIKRGQIEVVCPSCVAITLFTLQTNAPSGGAGHRTSLRGGGPLSTLVILDPTSGQLPNDLWRIVWFNILDKPVLDSLSGDIGNTDPQVIFPWLSATRTSEKKTGFDTTPLDAHPLQMYWGMPRRIRIHWQQTTEGRCDLCGVMSHRLVSHYTTQNYGTNYTGAWQHPLSPYRINKKGELLPEHAQPGGINYRHWLGLTSDTDGSTQARVVKAFKARKLTEESLRIHAFGYDMDNMKARSWYEATFPLFTLDQSIQNDFAIRVYELIEAATNTADIMRKRIKDAWFKRAGDAKGDTAFLVEAFLGHTEAAFFTQIKHLIEQLTAGTDGRDSLYAWHPVLSRTALEIFDYWSDRGDFEAADPRRIVEARRNLSGWLYSKKKGLPHLLGITLDQEKVR